ncbi:MAG TPA: hypothetical protein VH878_09570 [Thermodesulfobacteriota bacterium]|jgi:hypothetical protein
MAIKLIFKKVCSSCRITHRKIVFEGTKEEYNRIDELNIPSFQCCDVFDADSYEIIIDEKITKEGQIDDIFDDVEE